MTLSVFQRRLNWRLLLLLLLLIQVLRSQGVRNYQSIVLCLEWLRRDSGTVNELARDTALNRSVKMHKSEEHNSESVNNYYVKTQVGAFEVIYLVIVQLIYNQLII